MYVDSDYFIHSFEYNICLGNCPAYIENRSYSTIIVLVDIVHGKINVISIKRIKNILKRIIEYKYLFLWDDQ